MGNKTKKDRFIRKPKIQSKARKRIKTEIAKAKYYDAINDKYKKLTQIELSLRIGDDKNRINDILSGKDFVSEKIARKIADQLKMLTGIDYNPAYFTGLSEAMTMHEAQTFREEKEAKIEAIRRRNQSALDHFAVLSDAAETHGMTLRSIIDPKIDNPSVLSYLQSVTWSKQIPDRIFLLERDGKPIKQLSGGEYERLAAQLRDYAAQLIDEAITE